eukprot:184792_1
MSLEKVIQVNVLLDTLSQDEFDEFYSELTTACDKRELITKSLLHLLVHENKHNSNFYESNANRIVTSIIEKRNTCDPVALAIPIMLILMWMADTRTPKEMPIPQKVGWCGK